MIADSNPLATPLATGITGQSAVNQEQPLPQLAVRSMEFATALTATANAQPLLRNPRSWGLTER